MAIILLQQFLCGLLELGDLEILTPREWRRGLSR